MTIRSRVTVWYAGVLLVSLLLIAGGMYFELIYERRSAQLHGSRPDPMAEEIGEIILYFVLPAITITVLGGWWMLQRSLLPLAQLTLAAERLDADNLSEPLPRSFNGDEVDRLSQVLNEMTQRLARAMKEIHEFTLHASHELKTPLTIIHSEIETALANWPLSAPQRDSLVSQIDEVRRLTRIVEGLALLARTNTGQMPFAREPVAFHEIVRDAAEDAIVLAQSNQINVELQAVDSATVLGDRHRLRQMLLNLTENAAKYNQPNGLIRLSSRNNANHLILEVANTGPGIPSAEAGRIFERFFRGTNSIAREGVGLGLSIAQAIARAHHGQITVETNNLGWTIFRVFLPTAEAKPSASSSP